MRRVRSSSASSPSASTQTEQIEPTGGPIRAEIDQARAATERFRAKATELIRELGAREAKAREEAAAAEAASETMRAAASEAIERARRVEQGLMAKARGAVQSARQRAEEAAARAQEIERRMARLDAALKDALERRQISINESANAPRTASASGPGRTRSRRPVAGVNGTDTCSFG